MKELLKFIKVVTVLHISCALWYGIIGILFGRNSIFIDFLKGFLIMPFIFGNFIYLGCLFFASFAVYFILLKPAVKNKE